jgi:hypothetical protein
MKTQFVNFIFFFSFAQVGFSQLSGPIVPSEVLAVISSNKDSDKSELDKLVFEDSLLDLLRIHYEYLSYESKFKLCDKIQNENSKIILYKTIRCYPYYTVKNAYYGMQFYKLYIKATRDLIREYHLQGNLMELYNLNIVPGAAIDTYGFLRSAIEALGGIWDKGEIVNPEVTKKGNRHNR